MSEALESARQPALTRGARRRTETRQRLLAAARAVFARDGLESATVAQITSEADAGFGTFYLHFATKEDAYRAVITDGFNGLAETLDQVRTATAVSGATWDTMTRASVRAYCEFAARNRELFTVMFTGGGIGLRLAADLQEQFASRIAAQLVEAGEARGDAPASAPWPYPPMVLAIATVAALTRSMLWWLNQHTRLAATGDGGGLGDSIETVIESMSRYVIAALWGRIPD